MIVPKCAIPIVLFITLFARPTSAEQTPDEGKWLKLEKDGVTIEYQADTEVLARQILSKVAAMHKDCRSDSAADPAEFRQKLDELSKRKGQIVDCVNRELGIDQSVVDLGGTLDQSIRAVSDMRAYITDAFPSRPHFRIWRKEQLVGLLSSGHRVACFSYDAKTKSIGWEVDPAVNARSLSYAYDPVNGKIGGGVISWDAGRDKESTQKIDAWPIVVSKPGDTPEHASELDQACDIARKMIEWWYGPNSLPVQFEARTRPGMAVHEAAELALMANLRLGGAFRRWFCDGVANYLTAKCLEQALGRKDADDFLAGYDPKQYDKLKDRVDLLNWRAAEYSAEMPAMDTHLSEAHYALATREVTGLMKRHGPGALASICREIAQSGSKVRGGMEILAAIKKATGEDMRNVLAGYGSKSDDGFRGIAVSHVLMENPGGASASLGDERSAFLSMDCATNGLPLTVKVEWYRTDASGSQKLDRTEEKLVGAVESESVGLEHVFREKPLSAEARIYLNGKYFKSAKLTWASRDTR